MIWLAALAIGWLIVGLIVNVLVLAVPAGKVTLGDVALCTLTAFAWPLVVFVAAAFALMERKDRVLWKSSTNKWREAA